MHLNGYRICQRAFEFYLGTTSSFIAPKNDAQTLDYKGRPTRLRW